jgi:hypothetical protein
MKPFLVSILTGTVNSLIRYQSQLIHYYSSLTNYRRFPYNTELLPDDESLPYTTGYEKHQDPATNHSKESYATRH